jgi:hypothetical protein
MKSRVVLFACCALFAFAGCQVNPLTVEPQISSLTLEPDSIRITLGTEDTAFFKFNFTDGDADPSEIFLRDTLGTDTSWQKYAFPELPSEVADPELGLRGRAILPIPATFPLLQRDTSIARDTAQFQIYIRDRKGNVSNKLTTNNRLILINR